MLLTLSCASASPHPSLSHRDEGPMLGWEGRGDHVAQTTGGGRHLSIQACPSSQAETRPREPCARTCPPSPKDPPSQKRSVSGVVFLLVSVPSSRPPCREKVPSLGRGAQASVPALPLNLGLGLWNFQGPRPTFLSIDPPPLQHCHRRSVIVRLTEVPIRRAGRRPER